MTQASASVGLLLATALHTIAFGSVSYRQLDCAALWMFFRLATSRPHEFQGRIINKTKDFSESLDVLVRHSHIINGNNSHRPLLQV